MTEQNESSKQRPAPERGERLDAYLARTGLSIDEALSKRTRRIIGDTPFDKVRANVVLIDDAPIMRNDVEWAKSELTTPQRLLARLMSDISDECYCAGWESGLEFALWKAVIDGPYYYGQERITAEVIEELKYLSEQCGGWIRCNNKYVEEFVPLDEWERIYAEQSP